MHHTSIRGNFIKMEAGVSHKWYSTTFEHTIPAEEK